MFSMGFKTFSLSEADQRVMGIIQKALNETEGPTTVAQIVRRSLHLFARAHKIDVEEGKDAEDNTRS